MWLWGGGSALSQTYFFSLFAQHQQHSVRLSLTRVSVAFWQEWLWPTSTPAWQATRRRPRWTLGRGSTCWTWSPLARRSRRLPTHGNNWKRPLLPILALVQFHSFSSMVNSSPQRIFKQIQSLNKWRNIPLLPLYDHYFRFLIFCRLFSEFQVIGKCVGSIWIESTQKEWKHLKEYFLGTEVKNL